MVNLIFVLIGIYLIVAILYFLLPRVYEFLFGIYFVQLIWQIVILITKVIAILFVIYLIIDWLFLK
jgi:hypothetical protein